MRRSGYAKMSLQAEYGTVEEHEPIETHLRVENVTPAHTALRAGHGSVPDTRRNGHRECWMDMYAAQYGDTGSA
ncbi:MAG: hypothetical protein KGI54_16520 [Pseudomonadota bacterium]|nr:hypothetical protein [Pseudomonadota bacterium]